MPVTYTNRKGQTYFLCQGMTKTGKPRYTFASSPGENPLERIPEGYRIEESVNGVVSLARDRPRPIFPQEITVVEEALKKHPKGSNYRVAAKQKQIIVYERLGPDYDDLAESFSGFFPLFSKQHLAESFREHLEDRSQFSPMLRFNLVDAGKRVFQAERKIYVVSLPEWIYIGSSGPLQKLVDEIFPC